jgi:hypothetical protein
LVVKGLLVTSAKPGAEAMRTWDAIACPEMDRSLKVAMPLTAVIISDPFRSPGEDPFFIVTCTVPVV